MTYPVIHNCPVCAHQLHVRKLACSHCDTVIENHFSLSKFASLNAEQMQFVEVFVLKRGNIKEVEKALGISYPTVRGKLNQIIAQLGEGTEGTEGTAEEKKHAQEKQTRRSEVISKLEREEISPAEAIELLAPNSKEE